METKFRTQVHPTKTEIIFSDLPGVDNSKVIPSEPMIVWEDFRERKPKVPGQSRKWRLFTFLARLFS